MIRDIMRTAIPAVAPTDSVAKVAQMLVDDDIAGVLVIDDGELIGIVTEGDLITREADVDFPSMMVFLDGVGSIDRGEDVVDEMRRVLGSTARELMTAPVVSVRDSATLNEVATLMHERNINPVPIVNENLELVGIVSRRDLVRLIAVLEAAPQSGADSAGDESS